MHKTSLFDGIKRRFRSRSPVPRHTAAEGPWTGASQAASQAPEPPINSTQGAESSTSAQQTEAVCPTPALSDPYGIARDKYGLFRLAAPDDGSPG